MAGNKCVSRTDTNPPFAFQTAFPRGTDLTGFLQGATKSYIRCLCKVLVSGGNQGKVPVPGLSGEFGSTYAVDGPNTWEATDGHGPGDVRVGWRMRIEGLVA